MKKKAQPKQKASAVQPSDTKPRRTYTRKPPEVDPAERASWAVAADAMNVPRPV